MTYPSFKDRVALVTGASTGIGAATALRLAECGVKVAINYNASETEAKKVHSAIRSKNGHALLVKADVKDYSQVKGMVDRTLKEYGKVDILVNNAGGLVKRVPVPKAGDELWDETMNLNVRSLFYCSKAVAPVMMERKYGRIVNVSSIAAYTGGGRDATIYATAKGAVNSFTRGLAKELAPYGIAVNAVAPGLIDTPFHVKAETGPFEPLLSSVPMKRVGTAEEVASVIVYLASDESSYTTGSIFNINGGQYFA